MYAGGECWYRSDGSRGVASCQQFGLCAAGVPTSGASGAGAWKARLSAAREIDLLLLLQELCCYFPSRVLHLLHRLLRCVVVAVTEASLLLLLLLQRLLRCCCCCYRGFSVVVVVTEASLLLLVPRLVTFCDDSELVMCLIY